MEVQVLTGPLDIYYAAVGTTRPTRSGLFYPNKTTPTPWILIGDNLKGPDGITIDPSRSYNYERVMNQTHPIDSFISQADLKFSLPLKDMRLDALRHAFNNNAVAKTAATRTNPGYSTMPLDVGHSSFKVALMIVGGVPYEGARPEARLSWWVPRVNVEGPGAIPFKLAEASMYTITFVSLYHSTYGVGNVIEETAPPTA